jgi:hypothetical protein
MIYPNIVAGGGIASAESEIDLDIDFHRHRLPMLFGRFEAMLLHGFDRLLIQPVAQVAPRDNLLRVALRIHDH